MTQRWDDSLIQCQHTCLPCNVSEQPYSPDGLELRCQAVPCNVRIGLSKEDAEGFASLMCRHKS